MTLKSDRIKMTIHHQKDELDLLELRNKFFQILWEENKSHNRNITSLELYNIAVNEWKTDNLTTRPYIQLVKSWVEIAHRNGLVKKIRKTKSTNLRLTEFGFSFVQEELLSS